MTSLNASWLPGGLEALRDKARLLRGGLIGNVDTAQLPERVKARVRAQDEASERLIGWVQLALALTLVTLYLVAPRPADATRSAFAPVPWMLGGYIAFTVARLAMSRTGGLPGWMQALSIAVDTALLLGLIWLFHLQYRQPAAFSLKVPTFIYIIVLIAVRALRFDHRFVLAAGLLAAAGWTAMVLAAIRIDGTAAITRNFAGYLTSNTILIGAEVEKVLAILMVTAVLTIAVRQAQSLLVTAVRETAARQEIRRFLSQGVAETIAGADQLVEAGQATERHVAIMMIDIRGFTQFSTTVPPREVVRVLTEFHGRILPTIRAHGGVVDKFLGDGVMATFGAVKSSATPAADALAALGAVMAEAARARFATGEVDVPLAVNGAVAAGPVVFATLGTGDRLEYTVIGEAANLAAKLEKHNKVERSRAITDAETYALAIEQGFVPSAAHERRPQRSVAGVAEPVDLVVLAS